VVCWFSVRVLAASHTAADDPAGLVSDQAAAVTRSPRTQSATPVRLLLPVLCAPHYAPSMHRLTPYCTTDSTRPHAASAYPTGRRSGTAARRSRVDRRADQRRRVDALPLPLRRLRRWRAPSKCMCVLASLSPSPTVRTRPPGILPTDEPPTHPARVVCFRLLRSFVSCRCVRRSGALAASARGGQRSGRFAVRSRSLQPATTPTHPRACACAFTRLLSAGGAGTSSTRRSVPCARGCQVRAPHPQMRVLEITRRVRSSH
jgi:hypothetical protein